MSDELLVEVYGAVCANTVMLEKMIEEQRKTNGRLTKVEADGLMLKGAMLVLSGLITIGLTVVGIVIVSQGGL